MTPTRLTLTHNDRLIVHAHGDSLELWDELRRAYLARRPTLIGREGWRYPATTYLDVVEVANVVETALVRIATTTAVPVEATAAWRTAYAQIFEALNHHNLNETFEGNELFWLHYTLQLALTLSASVEQSLTPWQRRLLGKPAPYRPVR